MKKRNKFSISIILPFLNEINSLKKTIAILEKDVRSFLDGLADTNSNSNNAMVNFQNALLNGLKNIPTFPNN